MGRIKIRVRFDLDKVPPKKNFINCNIRTCAALDRVKNIASPFKLFLLLLRQIKESLTNIDHPLHHALGNTMIDQLIIKVKRLIAFFFINRYKYKHLYIHDVTLHIMYEYNICGPFYDNT